MAINRTRKAEPADLFGGTGFGFVRHFLQLILLGVLALAAMGGLLSWHFGMDVSVEGKGMVEPRSLRLVKTEISGILREVSVRQGQRVSAGQRLMALDGEEWKTELRKVEKDLEINDSRRAEIEVGMERERAIRRAEMAKARLEMELVALQLDQVRAEQQLYSGANSLAARLTRKPLEELLPVRQGKAVLQQKEAELHLSAERLQAVEGRQQEIRTLERLHEKLLQDRALLQYRLARTVIHAPVAGTVLTGDLHLRRGDRVQAGEALLELAELNGWQAEIVVQEADLPKVQIGQGVKLYIDAFPHMEYKVFTGAVDGVSIEPMADGRGYPVKVSIADPEVRNEERMYSLAYGMSATARIVVDRGRIAALLWSRILRSLGHIGQHDFYINEAGGY